MRALLAPPGVGAARDGRRVAESRPVRVCHQRLPHQRWCHRHVHRMGLWAFVAIGTLAWFRKRSRVCRFQVLVGRAPKKERSSVDEDEPKSVRTVEALSAEVNISQVEVPGAPVRVPIESGELAPPLEASTTLGCGLEQPATETKLEVLSDWATLVWRDALAEAGGGWTLGGIGSLLLGLPHVRICDNGSNLLRKYFADT